MNRLEGKIALVTGGAMGIGRSTVELFAAEGAWVIAADVAELPRFGDARIDPQHLDVTSEESWTALFAHIDATYGRLDVLIAAAGIIGYDPIDALSLEEWNRIIAVDQTGVFLGMREAIPRMKRQGGGSIVNFSSDWGVVGGVGVAAYNAAKGAVRSMSRNAAVTYARDGIRVNSMVPGWISTPLTDRQPADANARVIGTTPMGHGGQPIDIAFGCLFLAGAESTFVTGTDLVIDGGFLAV
jgi:NAD(P)-dependent dehydrogenase (short-subunit alcohol dehydrogenase family)